jgi:hypothetical protein
MHRSTPFRFVFSRALPRAVLAGAVAVPGILLSGCSQEDSASAGAADAQPQAPTTAATLRRGELMPLVFPGWEDKDAGRSGTVSLPDIGNDGKPVPGSEGELKADVSPREVVRLDDTHAVMLTETVPLDEQGQPMDSHAAGAWLGAYFFEQGPDGWTLAKRNDAVDYQGFMGNLGTTKVERIAPQRFVLTTTSGSCWQGYCGSWFSVYELGAGTVSTLAAGIPLSAENAGADEACEKVLRGERPETPPNGSCFEVDGTPEFTLGTDDEPGGMRIVFGGSRTASANGRLETVDSTAMYAYRKGAYVLTEGRNPVPSF